MTSVAFTSMRPNNISNSNVECDVVGLKNVWWRYKIIIVLLFDIMIVIMIKQAGVCL
jgi:hypothetical protein